MSKQDSSMKDFMTGLVVGGAIGAFATWMLTSKNSKNLNELVDDNFKKRASELAETVRDAGIVLVDAARKSKQSNESTPENEELAEAVDEQVTISLKKHTGSDDLAEKLESTKKAFEDAEKTVKQ
ncbi:hypothetical protein EJF36_15660 [Bacillus sp. HMF5848]|uniref:hypothetical protein n=1 Tax=Bacillus sp. HMF5848 TaxID=2495421 RepID=UPI000F78D3B8|nr:hypothetical protein [Bacillus sp. HMF5848]RSK28205.1 hypothetical protein EJF36_15660 [Bacillus sp. HMF5848]